VASRQALVGAAVACRLEEGGEGLFGVAVEAAGDVVLQERPAAVFDFAEQGLDQGDVVGAVDGGLADLPSPKRSFGFAQASSAGEAGRHAGDASDGYGKILAVGEMRTQKSSAPDDALPLSRIVYETAVAQAAPAHLQMCDWPIVEGSTGDGDYILDIAGLTPYL